MSTSPLNENNTYDPNDHRAWQEFISLLFPNQGPAETFLRLLRGYEYSVREKLCSTSESQAEKELAVERFHSFMAMVHGQAKAVASACDSIESEFNRYARFQGIKFETAVDRLSASRKQLDRENGI